MTLEQFAKRLRKIATDIEDLLGIDRPTRKETAYTAAKIRDEFVPTAERLARMDAKLVRARSKLAKAKKKKGGRGKAKKLHWTQTPEGRKKMSEAQLRYGRKKRQAEREG